MKVKKKLIRNENIRLAIIGLGYVGLPLAIEFSKFYKVIGYDIDIKRVNNISKNARWPTKNIIS